MLRSSRQKNVFSGEYTPLDSRPLIRTLVNRDEGQSEGQQEGQSGLILNDPKLSELFSLWVDLDETARADVLAIARGLKSALDQNER